MTPLLAAYVIGSVAVGIAGRHRRIGFVGFLIVSLVLSPLVAMLILWLSAPAPQRKYS